MPIFTRLTGIHGRRIAMSATGAIVDKNGYGAVMADASGVLQTIIKTFVELISSSGSTLAARGLSVFSSATATAREFTILAPSSGQQKEVFSLSSATTITLDTTATGIFFVTTGASSTRVTFSLAGGVFGETMTITGFSSTRWLVTRKTAAIT